MRSRFVIALLACALVGCAQPPAPEGGDTASAEAIPYKACVVVDKNSAAAQAGLSTAENELGVVTGTAEVTESLPYAQAIQQLVDADCRLILGQGKDVAEALTSAAKVNSDVAFALMDAIPAQSVPNLRTIVFSAHEAGYLAGYYAASQSETGVVGAFGGLNEPAVTIYLDGFDQGVRRWSADHADDQVKLVGWDFEKQTGAFVQSATAPYNDIAAGKTAAKALADQDADVIFAVAGASGEGALQYANEKDGLKIIWSDEDGCSLQANHCVNILASAIKYREATVINLIRDQQSGATGGIFVASLKNDGVALVGLPDDLDSTLKDDLAKLTEEITSGKTRVTSPASVG